MTSFQIRISNNRACQRALVWLCEHSEVNADGLIQVEKSIDGMGAMQVLLGEVNFEPAIPGDTKLRLIRQALGQWRQVEEYYNAEDRVSKFTKVLTIELDNLRKQETSFSILSFLNVDQENIESVFPLTIQESKLRLPTWTGLECLSVDDFWSEVEIFLGSNNKTPILKRIVTKNGFRYLKQTKNFTPIVTELKALDANTALHTAVDALDLFRAIINLPSAQRLFRRYGGMPSSVFLPSPVYGVFRDKGQYETLYYTRESYNYKLQTISADDLKYCTYLLSSLRNPSPGDLKSLLVKAVKLYQQAFDFTDYSATYLGLWQLLELLALNEPSHGYTQVNKRIACLLNLRGDAVLKDTVRILMESRNTFVHSGTFPEYANSLVFTLKGIVDAALQRIMVLARDLSTEAELREYYRLVSKGDADLTKEITDTETTKRVIRYIQNLRDKT